tara:strand:+ start:4 stop:945 length:942 start_codon:yes stop_codon:yes gene_type:complete
MGKLLVVFNTCGINGGFNFNNYCASLHSILRQDLDGIEIALSSCLNNEGEIFMLKEEFGDRISYNAINQKLPVSVTFNHTVEKCREKLGDFEGYVFVDSGINFESQTHALSDLYDLFKSDNYGMVAARTDDDAGFDDWFGTDVRGDSLFSDGHFEVPLGKAVNLHVQIFSNKLVDAYKRPLPDIFAGQCMESVFSFLCSAVKAKWVVHQDLVLKHLTGMDGPSSGFSPNQWQAQGKNRWDHLFVTNEPIKDIIERGAGFGMGYEECQGIAVHREDQFDDDGYCVNDDLSHYIRENLFLNSQQFDYDNIIHTFN